jgi:uncharacterized protein (UPF0254 family)
VLNADVVSRSDAVASKCAPTSHEVEELGVGIAAHAGVGRAALGILRNEIVNDVSRKVFFDVEDVVRNPEGVRHSTGVLYAV